MYIIAENTRTKWLGITASYAHQSVKIKDISNQQYVLKCHFVINWIFDLSTVKNAKKQWK